MKPLVTIGIPTYDIHRLSFLREAIASAQTQRYPQIEILVRQDVAKSGIDRQLQAACLAAAGVDSRIRYEASAAHVGLAGNWNAIADSARGDFLMLIGDDDRLLPDTVERLAAAAVDDSQVVFANHHLINTAGQRMEREAAELTHFYRRDQAPRGRVKDPEEWAWRNAIPISSALLRTEMVRRLRFKEDLNNPECELYLRLAQEGGHFEFVPEPVVEYRLHALSETAFGLSAENFVAHLLNIPARPDLETLKRSFLGEQMEHAVGRCLAAGDLARARRLTSHPYLESRGGLRRCVQRFCCQLPGSGGPALYRLFQHLKHTVR